MSSKIIIAQSDQQILDCYPVMAELRYEWGGLHSWLCNGLEMDSYRELNIRPNSHGFITNVEDACKSADMPPEKKWAPNLRYGNHG